MKSLIFRPAVQALVLLLAVMLMARTSSATTAVLLEDAALTESARVILLGEVRSVKSQWDLYHQNINTYVKVQVEKTLKGELQNQSIVFKQLGGTVGEDSTVIFGAPRYKVGQRVLLFLDTTNDGTLRVAHLFQGKYDVEEDKRTGQARVKRNLEADSVNILGATEGPDITNDATLTKFTKKIKKTLRAHAGEVSALGARYANTPIVEVPPEYVDDAGEASGGDFSAQYTFLGSYRWFEPDSGQSVVYRINPAASPIAGGGTTEINQALAAWTNVQTTSLVLANGGTTTVFGFQRDGVSSISYDDPLDQMSDPVGCSGTLAIGGVTSAGGGTITIGGQTFSHIFEGDVVFNRNFQCFLGVSANLAEVATHEIGHSIGFGHSPDTAAIMYASAHGNGRGATLGSDDIAAVSFLYPGSKGGTPTPPPPTATDNAAFVSQTAPSSLTAGQTAAVTVVMRNSGTTTWAAGSYFLGSQNPQDNTTWGLNRVALSSSVAPGANATFSFTITAPQTADTYNFQWKMFQSTAGYFGTASTNVAITVAAAPLPPPSADNAAFVSQSVPSVLSPGQSYTVTITMRNSGTSTWNPTSYKLGSQNPADNTNWGGNRVSLLSSVAPGGSVSFKFTVRAPLTSGVYNFQWQMVKDAGGFFGALTPNIAVQVGSGGGGGTNGAAFVSQNVPASMAAGQSAIVSVTMSNTGSTAWSPGTYFLGSLNPQGNSTWGVSQVNLPVSVAPGGSATFTFSVLAPAAAGTYNFQWSMMQSGAGYFGAASTNVPVSVTGGTGGGTNNATFISQTVPTSMNAGQTYTVSVTMRNSGTTTWAAGSYKLQSENPTGNFTWGLNQLSLPASVAPGADATFTFNVVAPSFAGSYNFQWRMLQDGIGPFGAFTTNLPITVGTAATPISPLAITTTSVPYGARGTAYSYQLSATGGTLPYFWSVTAGALPAGLALDANTGLISGTPSVGGSFTFTVTVRDRNNTSVSKTYKTFIQ